MFAAKNNKREKFCSSGIRLFALFAVLVGGIVTALCSLSLASGSYGVDMFLLYLENPYIMLLNAAPPVILSVVFYLLFNNAACSYILTFILIIVPSAVNYFKLSLRGDVFVFADLSLVGETSKMLESYSLFMNLRLWLCLAAFVLGIICLAVFARGRFRRKAPRFAAAICIMLASLLLVPLYTSEEMYTLKTSNTELINQWSDNQQYISKGFVYPFLYSVPSAFHPAPEGYNEKEARAALAAYSDETIPDDKKINIICVMLEAYADFSRFEQLTFTKDVYEKYHKLEKMGYSGTLITDIFAGDTRVSERQFLTGLPHTNLDDFVNKSNSYVWYLRKNGYLTTGSHPCYAWFYNRENINRNLGFENYLFSENYYKEMAGTDIVYDYLFFPMMRNLYYYREDWQKPYFSFSITYQGHGPYQTDVANYETPYVENPGVSEHDERIMNNYLFGIENTTEHLYSFANDLLATGQPLVLVFFGDHMPSMDKDGRVLSAYGINIDTSTEEGFENYYGTRYLILANDAAKQVSGNSFEGEGEPLSVSFLMNKVFELCGYKGNAYMQFTSDIASRTPVIHRYDDFSSGDRRLFDHVSYYYRKNFIYN